MLENTGAQPHYMAKKKRGGFGRLLGALTGTPYERLLKQVEKLANEHANDERKLGKALKKLVDVVGTAYEEEEIDEDEHDLVIEAIEEADPKGRSFPKFAEEDAFYASDAPDAPDLNLGKRKNLDELMTASGKEFTGSFGRDEFDEFKARMSEDFYADSDEAIQAGDHQATIRTENRVFADEEDELQNVKALISQESGLADPTTVEEEEESYEDDENYSIDEDGTEWFQDDDGYWWYREEGQADWQPYDED